VRPLVRAGEGFASRHFVRRHSTPHARGRDTEGGAGDGIGVARAAVTPTGSQAKNQLNTFDLVGSAGCAEHPTSRPTPVRSDRT
jgi:hypothetical protein